jgi:hypothetical protein
VAPAYRGVVDRTDGDARLLRTVTRGGESVEIAIVGRADAWFEVWAEHLLAIPGVRASSVADYTRDDIVRVRRHGVWIQIPGDVAHSNAGLLAWCRHHANSELPTGDFLITPSVWKARSSQVLAEPPAPFVPEFDEPDPALRSLATVESARRRRALALALAVDERRDAIVAAAAAGHSLRRIGHLVGLSFARVYQLINEAGKA